MYETTHSALKALQILPIAISWANSTTGQILFVNDAFTRLFGYEPGDIETVADWFTTYTDVTEQAVAHQRWRTFKASDSNDDLLAPEVQIGIRCKDGSTKTLLHEAILVPRLGLAVATFVDITDRKRNDVLEQSAADKERLEHRTVQDMLFHHSREMIVVSPIDRSKRYVSPGVRLLTGFSPEEYLAQEPIDLVHPDDWVYYLQVISEAHQGNAYQQGRYRTAMKDGGYCWIEAQVRALLDPDTKVVLGYVANLRDVAAQKDHEEEMAAENKRLSSLAAMDELTGIANRRTFNHALTAEGVRKNRSVLSTAILLIDIDYYKSYNDRFGHLQGDRCLQQIARALDALVLRANDVVARFGGDEFVLLLPLTDQIGAENIALKLIAAVANLAIPHPENSASIVTVSVGIACCPDSLPAIQQQLLLQADEALYAAKKQGRNTYSISLCEEIKKASD